jgi:hypothetical protein
VVNKKMDAATLNKILTFIETDFRAAGKLPATGQREVFQGTQISSGANCIIKLCPITPINVGRIQREIRVLGSLDSEYFPKLFHQTFKENTKTRNFHSTYSGKSWPA